MENRRATRNATTSVGCTIVAALRVQQPSVNFAYLAHHDARLVALATQAEEHFASDPPSSIAKLRLFAEVLAKRAAAKVGLFLLPNETQQVVVDRLFEKNVIGATQRSIFHDLHSQRSRSRTPIVSIS